MQIPLRAITKIRAHLAEYCTFEADGLKKQYAEAKKRREKHVIFGHMAKDGSYFKGSVMAGKLIEAEKIAHITDFLAAHEEKFEKAGVNVHLFAKGQLFLIELGTLHGKTKKFAEELGKRWEGNKAR